MRNLHTCFLLCLFMCLLVSNGNCAAVSSTLNNKKHISIIVNPISGTCDKNLLIDQVAQRLNSMGYDVEWLFTQAPHHGTQLAKEALINNPEVLAVVGGDGSVNEVAQALIGSDTALAIIPTGSGNGLARHLHIPLQTHEALELLEKGKIKKIDTVRINDKTYIGVAGIGFDAEVGWSFAASAKRGFFTYLIAALKMLPGHRSFPYKLVLDGKDVSREAFLISFANSSQFGNGASISPQAKISDGFLDVVIIKKFPFYAAFEMVYRLFHSSLHHCKYVEIIRCKHIDIFQPNLKAHIDGEPVFFQDGMQVDIIPSSLKVLVPAHKKAN